MDTILKWISVCLPTISTVLVAIITVRSENNKKVEELRKQQDQKEREERQKKLDDKFEELSGKIDALAGRIEGVEKSVESLQRTDKATKDSILEMSRQQHVNSEYVYELSKLITVIAEGIRDQHLDGNITNAVTAFRKFERDTLSQLITRPVVED